MKCAVCEGADRLSVRVIRISGKDATVHREDANYCPRCGRKMKEERRELRVEG